MSHKFFKAALLIAIIAVTAGWSFHQNNKETRMSELALANVEALALGESDCHNTNGYKSWETESWFGSKKEFYDCCNKLREGYSPSGNCQ